MGCEQKEERKERHSHQNCLSLGQAGREREDFFFVFVQTQLFPFFLYSQTSDTSVQNLKRIREPSMTSHAMILLQHERRERRRGSDVPGHCGCPSSHPPVSSSSGSQTHKRSQYLPDTSERPILTYCLGKRRECSAWVRDVFECRGRRSATTCVVDDGPRRASCQG